MLSGAPRLPFYALRGSFLTRPRNECASIYSLANPSMSESELSGKCTTPTFVQLSLSTFSTLAVSPASFPKRCLKQRYCCKPAGRRRILADLLSRHFNRPLYPINYHTLVHADLHRMHLCIPVSRNLELPVASVHTRDAGDS